MKLYYPKSHLDLKHRNQIFPLLKPFFREAGFTDEQRIQIYGVSEKDYCFVEAIDNSDIAILTMSWNYYAKKNNERLAIGYILEALQHNKKVLILNGGDFGVNMPNFENALVLRQSGDRHHFPSNHIGIPVFIRDPLLKWYNRNHIINRPYNPKPVVGFCGQVNGSMLNALVEILKVIYRNVNYFIGKNASMPQPILSSSFLRFKFLERLRNSPLVETNFIFRKKHGAGIDFHRAASPVTKEFFDNIQNSDYVLCYRGAGNFSVRFYETLAMGRIPVFVDSDCILPLTDSIDWKKHVIWIEPDERHKIAEKIAMFHQSLNEHSFNEILKGNRELWESKLQTDGYFKNLLKRYP